MEPVWRWFAAGSLLALAAGSAPVEVKFALKFSPGKTIRQQIMQSTRIDVTPPGQKDVYTSQIDQSWTLESNVKQVEDDGAAEVRQHFGRIALTLQLPPPSGKRFTADTAKPQRSEEKVENDMREAFAKVIGADWVLTIQPDGTIAKVGLSDELSDLLVDHPQVGPLADTFTEAGLRKLWDQSHVTFPSRAVAPGDSWEQTVTAMFPGGKLMTKRRCTYVGAVEDGLEKIAVEMESSLEPAKSAPKQWELASSSGEGEVYFDPRVGRTVRSRFKQSLVLKEGPPDRQGTQKIEMITTLLPADERPEPNRKK
jgi:hypothetical protein